MNEKKDAHKTGKYSKEKGKRFERTVANKFKEYGFDARRSSQYCGINGDADVIGAPKLHLECKAVESLNIYNAMTQSVRDAREGEIPVVVHKKSRRPILVTLGFDDFMEIYKGWLG